MNRDNLARGINPTLLQELSVAQSGTLAYRSSRLCCWIDANKRQREEMKKTGGKERRESEGAKKGGWEKGDPQNLNLEGTNLSRRLCSWKGMQHGDDNLIMRI